MLEEGLTIEQRLEHLILAHHKSIRAFAIEAGVHYNTLRSVLERGIMKSGIETMKKICHKLGITVDGLADGEIIFADTLGEILTPDERELLTKYRALDAAAQRRVLRNLNAEYEDAIASLGEESPNVIGTG